MLFTILLAIIGGLCCLAILFTKSAMIGICLTLLFATLGCEIGGVIDAAILDNKLRNMNKKAQ